MKIPWKLIAVAVGVLIVLVMIAYPNQVAKKYFGMLVDQIRVDQSNIVKTLEESVTKREIEIADLEQQIEINRMQQIQVRAENDRLKGRLLELQTQRETIVVSGDPDRIVDELRRLGFSSARRGCK